ncbi:MAG: diaminopimelate epimerase [Candidatus Nanopelagicales bacterium]
MTAGIAFAKGHGTGNDFVVLPDLDDALDVSPVRVRALCDRHTGIGADGVLVVRRTANDPQVADQAERAEYFMDYRNADGSVAQMCGNGARVFATHLVEAGLAWIDEPFQVATRGGPRRVLVAEDGTVTVDLGAAVLLARMDIAVVVSASGAAARAVGVLMPNPHAVVWVEDLADAGSLLAPPIVTPAGAYPEGVNVEFVVPVAADHLRMRVFERGVGETLSCGTGACAAAVATLHRAGSTPTGQRVRVDVPGGTVGVTWSPDSCVLDGPAVIVTRGEIDPDWWAAHG